MCADVIEFGHKVGNNRCISFGIQALAEEASSTAKDPNYRDTAKLTLIAAASLSGDLETVRAAVADLRDTVASGVQLPAPLFVDIGEALVMMGDGKLSEGMAFLERTIELASEASRDWEWLYGRSVKAVFLARIATGEIAGDWKTLVRNPRFVPYLRTARSSAGPELAALRDDAQVRGIEMIANVCDVSRPNCCCLRESSTRPARSWNGPSPSPSGPPRRKARGGSRSCWRGPEPSTGVGRICSTALGAGCGGGGEVVDGPDLWDSDS